MNFKVYVTCCLAVISLAMNACQPGGKFIRNYVPKLSKKDLRVGLGRNQRSRQDAWELLKAKQAQKSIGPELAGAVRRYFELTGSMPATQSAMGLVPRSDANLLAQTMSTLSDSHVGGSARPITLSRSMSAALLFALIFFVPCAEGFYYQICDLCVQQQRAVENHIAIQQSFANHYNLGVNYPASDLHCPGYTPQGHVTWGGHWVIEDCHYQNRRGKELIAQIQQKDEELEDAIKEYNRRVGEKSKHALAVDECASYAKLVVDQSPAFEAYRQDAQMLQDKLGQLIVFPETPQVVCPAMENWQSWTIEDAAAITQNAKTFLRAFKQKADEFNELKAAFNLHSQAVDECASYAKLVVDQSPAFEAYRQDAQMLQDKLGQLIVFPETPQVVCPAMENWQSWTIEDAAAITQNAKTFLHAFKQKADEFNELVNEHNKRMFQGETAVEVIL